MSDRIATQMIRLSEEAAGLGRPQISRCLFCLATFCSADHLAGNENRSEALMKLLGPAALAIAGPDDPRFDDDDEGEDPDFMQRN
jgi:hypothetical protein